jgi:hypothetical protein
MPGHALRAGSPILEGREESLMKCPKCDLCMDLEEKDTSSGRDMRTYFCPLCKERVDVDNVTAMSGYGAKLT